MIDVVLPVLDEAQALPWVLGRMPVGFNPIVVDNGSTDGSPKIARALGAQVITAPLKGFGAACFAGLSAAAEEIVCFMDCDASLDPGDLGLVAGPVENGKADLVLASRKAEPGAFSLHARLANRLLALEIRRRSGLRLTDLGPMRCARRDDLLNLQITDRRFGWPLEMVLLASKADWRILEVSANYRPRLGRSKVSGTFLGAARAAVDMAKALR